ncbi:EF-hand domain-containing protein [Agrobacterium vitis]|uniref:Calcium-binding protein n=1 Tax=Agrobacterium vitis TaxID=373 RepID=A0A7K1RGX7_AGRVI|nr:EF-hand domain-containing protein [Agrobacterium vitis]MVA57252.1 calcium-binding protein [Agrobacterium vitis]
MSAKKTTIAALAATLLVSASSGAVFAKDVKAPPPPPPRPEEMRDACGPRPMMMHGPAAMFIFALQQFDTNKDGKISKEEAKDAEDKLFTAIDTDKDGVLTPGELRKFHEARMEAMRAEMPKPPAPDGAAPADPNGPKPDAATDKVTPPPPGGPGAEDDAMGAPDDGMADCGPNRPGPERWAKERGPEGERMGGPKGPHGHRPMMAMGPMGGPMGAMRLLEKVDTDENGQISKAEADAALDKLFTRLDTNKDGFISADDFPKGPSLLP